MQTMNSVLCRRNSMALLSLYTLEPFDQHTKMKFQIQTIQSKSLLEDLPDELLIDIFQFLSPYDLHRSVYNLNSRLNEICRTQRFQLDLSRSKRDFDYYCSNKQPFSSQIYSLKLDDNLDRLILFNQYINIDCFINLTMLTIRESSSQNLDKILSKLHVLSHISYLNIRWTLIQSSNITEFIFKIRQLKRLILCSPDPIILDFNANSIHPLTELEYLEMDGCYMTIFFELLKYVGSNVKRMKIFIRHHRQQNLVSGDQTIMDQLLSNHSIPVLLRRMEVKCNFFSLDNLHFILRLFPHLMYLTFSTLTNDINFISPLIWHQFISIYLLELKQLQFYVEITGLLGNILQCPSTELIDSFYLINNKWLIGPVIMDYNSLLNPPVLEFYTYPQSVKVGKYSLQLYGKKRYVSKTVTNICMNIDKNITDLYITLNDDFQMATTIDQLSTYETNNSYPKVTTIKINSQMTRSLVENDNIINLIISHLIKSIPDLSKITSLNFPIHSPIFPSTTLTRRLLNKMPKVNRLELPYNYLLCLLKSPLIVQILTKKIETLYIIFDTDFPKLPDMIQILKIFSIKLHFLYFNIQIDFTTTKFYFIFPLLFSGICKKLYKFRLRLSTRIGQQPQIFNEQFKSRLKSCLLAQSENNKSKSGTMEYRIKDNEVLISF